MTYLLIVCFHKQYIKHLHFYYRKEKNVYSTGKEEAKKNAFSKLASSIHSTVTPAEQLKSCMRF